MISWLGKQSDAVDHPMSSMAEARKLLAELPEDDDAKALEEVTSWLGSVANTPGFDAELRLNLIGLLDETGWPAYTALLADYLSVPHLHDFHGTQLWRQLSQFTGALSQGYQACLDDYQRGQAGSRKLHKSLPLLCTRGLRAAGEHIKLHLMRYIDIPAAAWESLYRFYAAAESGDVALTLLSPYAAHGAKTCAQHEVLRTLMLHASSPGNLAPEQVELCSRIARRMADLFDLSSRQDEDSEYRLDLDRAEAPAPCSGREPSGGNVRYFSALRALPALREIIAQHEDGELARERRFGEEFTPDGKLTVLKHLAVHWDRDHPHRRLTRRGTTANVDVVHGFRTIARVVPHYSMGNAPSVSGAESAALTARGEIGLDPGYRPEIWTVIDASLGGMGAMIPKAAGAWIKVGSLCGIKLPHAELWWIAVIRRLHTDTHDIVHAGIEVLAKRSLAVWLRRPATRVHPDGGKHDYVPAILLPDAQNSYINATILLESGAFAPGKNEEVLLGEGLRKISLTSLENEGDDYELVKFIWLNP